MPTDHKVRAMVNRSNMAIIKVAPPRPDWSVAYRVERVTQGIGKATRLHPEPRFYGFVGTGGLTWDWDNGSGVGGRGAATRDLAAVRLIAAVEQQEGA